MTFDWRRFQDLELETLYRLLQQRSDVFVLEQQSLYRDLDGRDQAALHLLYWEEGSLLGSLRVELAGSHRAEAVIGRVVLEPAARGRGLGRAMLQEALRKIEAEQGRVPVFLGAQTAQRAFYESFGFKAVSAPYDDGGIEHLDMLLSPS
jgi:ElaA protein